MYVRDVDTFFCVGKTRGSSFPLDTVMEAFAANDAFQKAVALRSPHPNQNRDAEEPTRRWLKQIVQIELVAQPDAVIARWQELVDDPELAQSSEPD
jgi:hypothetical protein